MSPLLDFRSFHQVDAWVEHFEQALVCGTELRIQDYLPPSDHPLYEEVLSELIRVDLEHHWDQQAPRKLAHYQTQFPDFFRSPTNCRGVAYEEYRLRQMGGEAVDWKEYQERFNLGPLDEAGTNLPHTVQRNVDEFQHESGGRKQSSRVRQLARTVAGGSPEPSKSRSALIYPALAQRLFKSVDQMPEPGGEFLGFHLTRELGRGAFGRVFLAQQRALAHRLVALKVAPDLGGESRALAQLQHTNVVPIYSIHREGSLQATCMPFFGSTTLADVLKDIQKRGVLPVEGGELSSTIESRALLTPRGDSLPGAHPEPTQNEQASGKPVIVSQLAGLSYVEAILWIGRGLADGLAHAHERGILHRDIKPANVLLTDEGQPMLLDFNLATDTKETDPTVARVGGTLPYMAPEQFEAFCGEDRETDGRSDVYSLGVVLYELLTGRHPFELPRRPEGEPRLSVDALVKQMLELRKKPIQPARELNRRISPAVEAIVDHCLESDPARRYQSARELQEDLQRQLESRPLKYARERSWREMLQKQMRRSPKLFRRVTLATMILVLILAGWLGMRLRASQKARGEQAKQLVLDRRKQVAREHKVRFHQECHEAMFHLSTQHEQWYLDQGMKAAKRALGRFHVLDQSNWKKQAPYHDLSATEKQALDASVGPLLFLMTASRLREGQSPKSEGDWTEPLTWINRADECLSKDAPSRAVQLQRADLLEQMGRSQESKQLREKAETTPLKSAADYFLIAQRLAIQQKHEKAMELLDLAWNRNPEGYWINFLRGVCCDQLGLDEKAAGAYRACMAIEHWHYGAAFNLGLAQLRLRSYVLARRSFDRAIEKRPELPNLYVNRALVWMGQKENDEAILDLTQALKLGAGARAWFLRSRAKQRSGDDTGAKADYAMGLKSAPTDEVSWNARGLARLKNDPEGALKDFEQALRLNPRSRKSMSNKAHVLSEKLKRPREAIQVLDRMIRLFPDHVASWSGRGVLWARLGDRKAALQDAHHTLQKSSHPSHLYQVGCIYALTSKAHPEDQREAMRLITRALDKGFGSRYVATDPDLDPLRKLPEFQRLLQAAATLRFAR